MEDCHPILIQCNLCDAYISKNSELEMHLEASHEQNRDYACDQCDKKFVIKFRLKKHVESHADEALNFVIISIMGKNVPLSI